MKAPLAWLQLIHNKPRLLVALAGIGFADLLMFLQLGFQAALFESNVKLHQSFQGDLFLLSPQSNASVTMKPFSRRRIYQSLAVEGVQSATSVYMDFAIWKNPVDGQSRGLLVFGLNPDSNPLNLPNLSANLDAIKRKDTYLFDDLSRPEFGPIPAFIAEEKTVTAEMEEVSFDDPAEANKWALAVANSVANASGQPERQDAQWNGSDWYFAFGGSEGRRWEDAVEFGFVSAGGGDWYSKTVKALPVGARLFVYMPKIGYVGVGVTTGLAINYSESAEWKSKKMAGRYIHDNGEPEFLVPVRWIKTLSPAEAIYGNGLFASQHSACKIRDQKTLKVLTKKFDVPFVDLK
jgi:hypothetical protein